LYHYRCRPSPPTTSRAATSAMASASSMANPRATTWATYVPPSQDLFLSLRWVSSRCSPPTRWVDPPCRFTFHSPHVSTPGQCLPATAGQAVSGHVVLQAEALRSLLWRDDSEHRLSLLDLVCTLFVARDCSLVDLMMPTMSRRTGTRRSATSTTATAAARTRIATTARRNRHEAYICISRFCL